MNKVFAFLISFIFLVSACKDPCKEVNCNFGTCLDGTCLCDDGYEGANCDQEERAKFLGRWTGDVDCGSAVGAAETTLIVTADPNNTSDLLFDLDLGFEQFESPLDPIKGTVAGDRIFITPDTQTIEIEELGLEFELTVGGEGQLNDDGNVDIQLSIITILVGGELQCTGLLVKE